jgi:hypothetical protein
MKVTASAYNYGIPQQLSQRFTQDFMTYLRPSILKLTLYSNGLQQDP